MNITQRLIAACVALATLASCHHDGIIDEPDTADGNFRALWEIIDTRYCFLDKQGVDWDSVYTVYAPQVGSSISTYQLFRVCSEMLNTLRDGHVNLSSPFGSSYYRGWWDSYPANFDSRVVTLNYLLSDYQQMGAITYGTIQGTGVGYVRISSFESAPGEGNIDFILNQLNLSPGLIVDVRGNGGGQLTAAQKIAERFISAPVTGAYLCHKTGPGHNDFSEPRAVTFTPPSGHILWSKPVILLTNRSTFSAANYFAAFMRTLPNVTQVGATTGGGGGMPFSSSLPNGWTVRFSACPILDPDGQLIEDGVSPAPDNEVNFDLAESAAGRDPILDRALSLLLTGASKD